MATDKISFIFYCEYKEQLALLSGDDCQRLIFALIEYAETGTPPAIDGIARMAFTSIRQQMDRDNKKWEKTRQARVEASQRAVQAKKTKRYQTLPNVSEDNQTSPNVTKPTVDVDVDVDVDVIKPPRTPSKKKYAEFVSMTNDEYSSLVAELGEAGAKRCVEILDNYKGANGKKYKSDYRAIRNWVVSRYEEERPINVHSPPKRKTYFTENGEVYEDGTPVERGKS